MDLSSVAPAIQLMIALLFWEISKHAIRLFLGKTIGADNVCWKDCRKIRKEMEKELRAIKGVLLMVAIKSGIEPEKLKSLAG